MCGIAAIFSPNVPVAIGEMAPALRLLAHRGPDRKEFWRDSTDKVILGHTRLRVMDLETGDQPMANEAEDVHIIVNGEFYGFEDIRHDLESKGHVFSTNSDSEILLHLYEEMGTHCLSRLRGEFAFALWDARNETLFAARDRFGIKPIYYSMNGGTLRLASEVKALFALGSVAAWDNESLYQTLLSQYPLESRSLFRGIYQLSPGHFLLATSGAVEIRRYWDFNFPLAGSASTRPEQELVEEYRTRLDEAIQIRLRSDVPVAFYLSGGLDSCSLLSMATPHLQQRADAFTVMFDDEDYDESRLAQQMAEKMQARWHPVSVDQSALASHFSDATWHCETLSVNTHSVAKYLLSRAVRDAGFKVVLTGEGADDVLAGYEHFRMDVLLHDASEAERFRGLAALEKESRHVAGYMVPSGEQFLSMDKAQRMLGFVPSWFRAKASLGFRCQGLIDDGFKAEHGQVDVFEKFLNRLDLAGQVKGRTKLDQALYLYEKSSLPNYILSILGDRMEMAHSIEARLPFLDHPLVEFAVTLPASLKIRLSDSSEKFVLREAVKGIVPDAVRTRKKHGFLGPWSFRTQQRDLEILINDTLRGGSLPPCYDRVRMATLLDRLPSLTPQERTPYEPILMMALSACFLQEHFRIYA